MTHDRGIVIDTNAVSVLDDRKTRAVVTMDTASEYMGSSPLPWTSAASVNFAKRREPTVST